MMGDACQDLGTGETTSTATMGSANCLLSNYSEGRTCLLTRVGLISEVCTV